MKHVTILSDTLPPEHTDEAGRTAWTLGQGLLAAGHRVTFVTATTGPSTRANYRGVPVYRLHSNYAPHWRAWFGLMNPQTLWPLNRLLRRLAPDIVHAHNVATHLSYHSLVIGRFAGAATVYTAHDVLPIVYRRYMPASWDGARPRCRTTNYRLPFVYNLRREGIRWNPARNLSIRHTMRYYTDARVAVSHALKAALEANRLAPFHVVHPGVELRAFEVPDAAVSVWRQRWGLHGRRVVLCVSDDVTSALQALSVLERVRQRIPETMLVLFTEHADAVRKKLATTDLAPHVRISAPLSTAERAAAYRAADAALVFSAHFAPFPLANVEAMTCGTPTITSCFGGGAEAVLDGETGFVVDPFETEAVTERVLRLLTDATLRERMSRAARARATERFSRHAYTARMLEIYEQAITYRREKT